jgi:hypothetical protein
MTKVKNTSFTLFRWQDYIWRPDEVIVFNESGQLKYEDILAYQLTQQHGNLVIVTDEPKTEPVVDKREAMLARLEKARAARKTKNEKSDPTP